jgi:hypothetical protein
MVVYGIANTISHDVDDFSPTRDRDSDRHPSPAEIRSQQYEDAGHVTLVRDDDRAPASAYF